MANQEHLNILKQGIESWNTWRREQTHVNPDLRGKDFRWANLSRAFLNRTDLSEAILREVDLSWANLSWANLSKADLTRAMSRSQGTMHIRLAGSANQFTSVVSEKSMECSFVFCCNVLTVLFYLILRTTEQVIKTGNVITHLYLKLTFAIKRLDEETILFLVNCDAFHADLI